jgi:urease alpha subunit
MDMPIHMVFQLMDESKKRERARIKRVIQKYVNTPTLLQQILEEIDQVQEATEIHQDQNG